ncbi:hypothetical protein ACSU1N_03985 [Thermogladius sp. 4427co]|uniref:hypothetical protein n=1 Tax=Thermogladius sp. 4427co TaxID=3450718 RepID=UPI003F7A7E2D
MLCRASILEHGETMAGRATVRAHCETFAVVSIIVSIVLAGSLVGVYYSLRAENSAKDYLVNYLENETARLYGLINNLYSDYTRLYAEYSTYA